MAYRKCSVCKTNEGRFTSGLKRFCGPECGTVIALSSLEKKKKQEAKEYRKEINERKQKLNDTVPYWTKKAQVAFNNYIRCRDYNRPCISCGKPFIASGGITGSNIDCGHYRSVGSCPELRYEPLNAHAQHSRPCNKDLSGDTVNYRRGLIDRIGVDDLEWLEGPHEKKHYRVEELKEIASHYRKLTRELKKQRDDH